MSCLKLHAVSLSFQETEKYSHSFFHLWPSQQVGDFQTDDFFCQTDNSSLNRQVYCLWVDYTLQDFFFIWFVPLNNKPDSGQLVQNKDYLIVPNQVRARLGYWKLLRLVDLIMHRSFWFCFSVPNRYINLLYDCTSVSMLLSNHTVFSISLRTWCVSAESCHWWRTHTEFW